MDLMADLVQKLSGELRTGFQPAYDNFLGFFHAIDWKVMNLSFVLKSFVLYQLVLRNLESQVLNYRYCKITFDSVTIWDSINYTHMYIGFSHLGFCGRSLGLWD